MKRRKSSSKKAFWVKQLHQWHWISSALCLLGMLLFAVTGITLNHADEIGADAKTINKELQLPAALLMQMTLTKGRKDLPGPVADWFAQELSIAVDGREAEYSAEEVYVSLPRPGGDGWLSIQRDSGEVLYEELDRGWIAWLNDLHKGRHTGMGWRVFLDVFSVVCLVFCVTGLLLLQLHAGRRWMTWPTVGMGLLVPMLLAFFFVH